jgi:hypothetical protein
MVISLIKVYKQYKKITLTSILLFLGKKKKKRSKGNRWDIIVICFIETSIPYGYFVQIYKRV